MNFTPYWHLCWKEYRSVRLFWVAVIVLTLFMQWLALFFGYNHPQVFMFAFGFPALFVVGCAGVSFAGEKEEGTFDYLRAAPISSRQIFVSKLTVTVLATLAMYLVLWVLSSLLIQVRPLESPEILSARVVFIAAALQALAWGTFFSLLLDRPLLAVILAVTAGSAVTHFLAWHFKLTPGFDFEIYVKAAPWMAIVALAVLAVDVALGLRWLHGDLTLRKSSKRAEPVLPKAEGAEPSPLAGEGRVRGSITTDVLVSIESANAAALPALATKRDRAAMLGRLFWQHWRQSAVLMGTLGGLMVVISVLSIGHAFWNITETGKPEDVDIVFLPMTIFIFAALMGCVVFLSDQSRRQFRFFVEHNVPPRYVWLTRQLSWLAALVCSVLLVGIVLQIALGAVQRFWWAYQINHEYATLPPMLAGFVCMVVVYSAGQFVSMLVRSTVLSAFFGLLLAGACCFWMLLMLRMQVPFWWSVWPIPVVLLTATWLRAPDWVRENNRPWAWAKLAAVVLVPALAVGIALPLFRVHQIPKESPGFVSQQYLAEFTPKSLATGEMYRQAALMLPPNFWEGELLVDDRKLSWRQQIFVGKHADAIDLLVEASQQPTCHFIDLPDRSKPISNVPEETGFVTLLLWSGRQLEAGGKLDQALDRYFDALHVVFHFSSVNRWFDNRSRLLEIVFYYITQWGAEKGQSVEQIRAAIAKLQALDADVMRIDNRLPWVQWNDRIMSYYEQMEQMLQGDREIMLQFNGRNQVLTTGDVLWNMLMPWENDRAERMLNLLSDAALDRLRQMHHLLQVQIKGEEKTTYSANLGIAGFVSPALSWFHQDANFFLDGYNGRAQQQFQWLKTTMPNLDLLGEVGISAAEDMAKFEAQRRATMILLALEAYRLEHGKLPAALADLTGKYFDVLPPDPYSGLDFEYYPAGILWPSTPLEDVQWTTATSQNAQLMPGIPGVWCSTPALTLQWYRARFPNKLVITPDEQGPPVPYFMAANDSKGGMLSTYEVLPKGMWFPLQPSSDSAAAKATKP